MFLVLSLLQERLWLELKHLYIPPHGQGASSVAWDLTLCHSAAAGGVTGALLLFSHGVTSIL